MRRFPLILTLVALLAACGADDGSESDSGPPQTEAADTTDTLTAAQQRERRQRAVAESQLPGAGAVGKALDSRDATRARAAAMDSTQ